MWVASVAADSLRSLDGVKLELDRRVTAIVGPNGAGKTNLVEAVYFGLTGRSFRTADRRDLIPFGASIARCRVVISGENDDPDHVFMASSSRGEGSRYTMDGAGIERSEAASYRPATTVFSPDRLELVKGPPSGRRAHVDSYIAARWPSRNELRRRFGRALAQRNALIARLREGGGDRSQLTTWNHQFAASGSELAAARDAAVRELGGFFTEAAADLGLDGETDLAYRPGSAIEADAIEAGLEERIENDLRLGRTSWGPHHDEIRLELDGRQLRRFGSQGQQRIGLLALLFAERSAILGSGANPPLMLLDDVMSELDGDRRGRLVGRLLDGGQSLITAAEPDLVPPVEGVRRIAIEELTAGAG
ncbi:MAG: DNA replication and repair protein RecF [Thermoleophilia bacterium]|nr:DNA replication and repair protein RecF [Thermoleophilia bacterium]